MTDDIDKTKEDRHSGSTSGPALRDRALDEAAYWFARLRAEDVTPGEREAHRAWLDRSTAHRRAYEDLEALWGGLDGLPALAAARGGAPSRKRSLLTRRRVLVGGGAAAAAAAVAVLAVGPDLTTAGDRGPSIFATALGEQRTVQLPDGSRVHLNTASEVSVAFTGAERSVRLTAGEAFFSVAPEPSRPFIVRTAAGAVTVTGTRFNVRLFGDGADVSVVEGHVAVSTDEGQSGVALAAGEAARLYPGSVPVARAADTAAAAAWHRGLLVYRDQALEDVLADLDRYFEGGFAADPAVAGRRVTGTFRLDRREAVTASLATALGLEARRQRDVTVFHAPEPAE